MSTDGAATTETPAALVLEQWTLDLLGRVASEHGFSAWSIKHAPGSNVGDNFMGIILRVTIDGQRQGRQHSLSCMLKMPPHGAARRKQFHSSALFERETLMYRDILPMFTQFQLDKGFKADGADGFFAYPKCLGIVCDAQQDRFAIVLEDLRPLGYSMFNKSDIINLEHVRFVMEEMGKFHGVSFALRDQRPELFEPLAQLKDIFLENLVKGSMEVMSNYLEMSFARAIGTLAESEVALKTKLDKFRTDFVGEMEKCVGLGVAGQYSVVNHGDCWNNNMMYRYKESSKVPQQICLIDFQIARYSSPVLDLVYFLFSSTTKELRDAHLEDILRIYHTALSATVNRLGSDAERLFNYATFRQELIKFGKYGVIIAPMLLQVITAHADDIPDLDQIAEDRAKGDYKENNTLFQSTKTELNYNKRMSDVLRDADAYGFLNDL